MDPKRLHSYLTKNRETQRQVAELIKNIEAKLEKLARLTCRPSKPKPKKRETKAAVVSPQGRLSGYTKGQPRQQRRHPRHDHLLPPSLPCDKAAAQNRAHRDMRGGHGPA